MPARALRKRQNSAIPALALDDAPQLLEQPGRAPENPETFRASPVILAPASASDADRAELRPISRR
jgi:hypothetical protein